MPAAGTNAAQSATRPSQRACQQGSTFALLASAFADQAVALIDAPAWRLVPPPGGGGGAGPARRARAFPAQAVGRIVGPAGGVGPPPDHPPPPPPPLKKKGVSGQLGEIDTGRGYTVQEFLFHILRSLAGRALLWDLYPLQLECLTAAQPTSGAGKHVANPNSEGHLALVSLALVSHFFWPQQGGACA
jgi:hypothetical protein